MTAKRASFKARHSANIAKGPSSAAYWANKVKWADGGSVRTNYAEGDSVQATPQSPALSSIANFLKQSYSPERTQQMQGMAEFFDIPALARTVERMSYGEPITNVGKANVPMLPDDTAAAAMLVGPMGGPLAKYAKRVGTNLVQTAPFVAKDIAQSMTAPTRSYVVKPEAGNWLAGSIESAVGPLKTGTLNETGLRNLAERQGVDIAENVRVRQEPSIALNKWIDQKVDKYIRNEMATPSDRLRLLADEGISHVQLDPNRSVFGYIPLAREQAGFPKEGLAKTPLGKQWENKADELITNQSAGVRLKQGSIEGGFDKSAQDLIDNPWLAKVPPETDVYSLGGPYGTSEQARSLGFNHLIDELDNAINPESTLPANLRLTLKQLDKVTMPDAVKLVSKINDWRAAEAAKAELAGMSDNLMAVPRLQDPTAQLSFVKEPGMTWVDIPATTDKKAKKLCTTIGKQAGWCTQGDSLAETYGSGNNRLTTLLDADGRPHAQAKISSIPQSGDIMEDIDDLLQSMTAAERRKFNNFLGSDDFYGEQEEALEWLQTNMPKAYDRYIASVSGPPSIGEIKPVGNYFDSERALEYEKRDPQYRAKITDSVVKFLNSGEWSQVNDLDIYDIVDTKDPTTIKKFIKVNHMTADSSSVQKDFSKNYNGERFVKAEKFDDLINDYIPRTGGYDGYAKGGSVSVYDPDEIDEIMNSLDDPTGYAEGGTVRTPDMDFVEDPESFRLYKHAMKQLMPNQEDTISSVSTGARGHVAGGDLSAGIDIHNMSKGQQDQLMKILAANYNADLGDLNLNARLEAPLDAKDVFVGMLNGSIPIGEGRAMLGVQGIKTPYGSDVLGYNAGYSGKVGPGRLNVNVNKPKRGKPSAQVQYQIPFAEGGSVHMGKGGVVKAALEEIRNRMLKLKALEAEGKYHPENLDEYPTRFYRGMASMVKGGKGSPKYIDDITEQYLNSREPLSSIDSLVAAQRPSGALSDQKNMRRNNAWAASNPLTAASYATTPNSVMIPLELTQKPGAIFDAQGLRWDKFFSQTGKLSPSGNYVLRDEFKDALRDPKVKSILVKNIIDSGVGSRNELSRLYGVDIGLDDLMSSNLLIKDPSVVKYRISGETPTLKESKVKKAEGGSVRMAEGGSVTAYDPDQVDEIANQYM
jgi:hypothetical protein